MFPLFQIYLNHQFKTNKLINIVVYHPFPSRLASMIHPFIFFKLLRVLSLSRMLDEFSLTYIFYHVWENISIYGVPIPRKCIECMHFYLCPSLALKMPGGILWTSVSPKTKGVEETMICFIKIQSKNMKWLGTLLSLYFVSFVVFLNAMALQFCE